MSGKIQPHTAHTIARILAGATPKEIAYESRLTIGAVWASLTRNGIRKRFITQTESAEIDRMRTLKTNAIIR